MEKFSFHYIILLFFFVFVLNGCQKDENKVIPVSSVESEKADVAVKWMNLIRTLVKSEGKNPPQASRIYAYTGVTLYESLLPAMPNNKSFSKQLNGFQNVPVWDNSRPFDGVMAANEALANVCKNLFVTLKPENQQKIDSLYNYISESRTAQIGKDAVAPSNDFGKKISDFILQWASLDNFTETRSMSFTVPSRAGHPEFWEPTTAGAAPLEPYWGRLRTFALVSASACYVPTKIPFDTASTSTFYKEANFVYTTGVSLTQEQKDIAKWWADGATTTATPPGHWVGIENQMATRLRMNLQEAAEMYALVGIAMADAFISCWDCKYKINLLRPITYIHENIDANWMPLLTTPNFPEYTSGHSSSSGAASEMLTQIIGNQGFIDSTNTNLGFQPRYFSSFEEAAEEAAMSRVYGGIHYREAGTNGLAMGRCISQTIQNSIVLHK